MSVHQEKVFQILREQFGVDADEVSLSTNLVDDLNMDSLDQVELLMALEDDFDIEIPDAEFEEIKTVQELVNYIDGRLVPKVA